MLIRCLQEHSLQNLQERTFRAGTVYDTPDEMGRRLLQDFGRNSAHVARQGSPKFERVLVEGDTITIVQDGESQPHVVSADEAYKGDVVKVEEGAIDHTHLSTSEPQRQPAYAPEGETLDPVPSGEAATAADATTATQTPSAAADPGYGDPTGTPDMGPVFPTTPASNDESPDRPPRDPAMMPPPQMPVTSPPSSADSLVDRPPTDEAQPTPGAGEQSPPHQGGTE